MPKSGLSGKFYGELLVKPIDGNMWELEQVPGKEFGIEVSELGRFTPDDGFLHDFASIPRPVRWMYPKCGTGRRDGQYGCAAVIHDYLYSYAILGRDKAGRELADRIFLLGMEIKKVRYTMRSLFYYSVRIGGRSHYGNPSKLERMRKG